MDVKQVDLEGSVGCPGKGVRNLTTQSRSHRPGAAASLRSLLEMQAPRSQPRPTESESILICVVDTLTFGEVLAQG